MKPAVKVQILENLKFLKLAAVIANLESCIRQAREASLDPSEFLLNITELEAAARMENGRKRRIRDAKTH